MNLQILNQLCFENNDIYRLEICSDKIITNEDYYGIRILNFSLNTLHVLSIINGLKITFIYKKTDETCIALYDPDNNRLIFVDLQTFSHYIVSPDDPLDNYLFSDNYYWQNEILIFSTQKHDKFYQFNFETHSLQNISTKKVKIIAPTFFDFWKMCKKYRTVTIYPNQKAFIFHKNRNLIAFYDYKEKKLILACHKPGFFEEIYYYDNSFIYFDMWNKRIRFQKYNKQFLRSEDPYYCLRIQFLDKNTFVLLLTHRENHQLCCLVKYKLQDAE